MRSMIIALVVMMPITACASVDASELPRLEINFVFDQKNKCQWISPEIRLMNVPSGVASFEVRMTDLDMPSFHHWAQTIPATGSVIREGAGSRYYGPCPPSGTHRYRIAVTALDSQKKPIAYGEMIVVAGR
jgi:phosphatidylethanolamine-binding protein (PEBP) family uncharacterized protein